MNPVKKIYCRTFQVALKTVLPILPYRDPKLLHSVSELPDVFAEKKIKKVLIVTDKWLHNSGMLTSLKDALVKAQMDFVVYDETTANPTIQNVEEAREYYLVNKCEALIGFGGGSSIDCAKAIGARIARPHKSIQKMRGILKVMKRIPFLVAVPTTAGTGSETTLATVITDEKTGHKFPINDFPLIPRVAVLDPELTRTLPPHLTATTGMDALTHAIEAYIGCSTTFGTRKAAIKASALVAENLETAYKDGNNMEARKNMLKAAYFAGKAFTKSYVGYCHAVAHSLGGEYHVAHGLANAVLLPYVLKAYGSSIYGKAKNIAIAMHLADKETPAQEACETLIAKIEEMNKNMGIPNKIEGIKEEDINRMAGHADKEANPLYPVPKLMSKKQLKQFYYDVME